jgi:ERCC4-related helicase
MVMSDVPVPGQLVEVRRRHFVVNHVQKSAISPDPTRFTGEKPQHLVQLSCVEEGAEGEELQVIWELEPGAFVKEKMDLPEPTGYDHPKRMDAFLNAIRWGAVASADVNAMQAPFRSGIEIEDYQLDPLVRAIRMPRVNLLIADDVGLGKTIEAGLVIQELIVRMRAHSVLIVCPASIQSQWQKQMREKFGLEFRIVDTQLMRDLRRRRGLHVNPWTHFPRLITSIDYLKRDRPMRLFREVLPPSGSVTYPRKFDILVVDEAHNVAPSGTGRYAVSSQRTESVRTISPHFEHRLFLTATPHNGYKESFSALLELLDNRRFSRVFSPDPKQLQAVMVRRIKTDLPPKWDGTPRFAQRKILPIEVDYTDEERQIHSALKQYSQLRINRARETEETLATEFVLKMLKKRLFSSPEAFRTTLEKHLKSLTAAAQDKTKALKPSLRSLRERVEGLMDDFDKDEEIEENQDEVVKMAGRLMGELSGEEKTLLTKMRIFAEQFSARADSKAGQLLTWLKQNIKPNDKWSQKRVLIFTEYRATQKWLTTILSAHGLTDKGRFESIYGGMDHKKTEEIKASFQADPVESPLRILLATDCASEGIDLQNHCNLLIHYEIPWNPNRMEQRNGRLDRHGQRSPEVLVYHFVGRGCLPDSSSGDSDPGSLEGDLEFLWRVVEKIKNIRRDLGGKVGPVIAAQVEEAMLGRRSRLDTSRIETDADATQRLLRFERDLKARIDKLLAELNDSKEILRINPRNIQAVVETGLELAGQPALIPVNGKSPSQQSGSPMFHLPMFTGSWASCAEGIEHPYNRKRRPIVFDPELARGRDNVVLAHLNHRLVQMCLRLLREEIWAHTDVSGLHRVCARMVDGDHFNTPVVIAHGRLVILGGDNRRLHEEIIDAGGYLKEGRFTRMNVTETRNCLSLATEREAPERIKQTMTRLWSSHSNALSRALEARMQDRTVGLKKHLMERSQKEITDLETILLELQKTIKNEIGRPLPEQHELWPDEEISQLKRDIAALKARLEKIPEEIRQETEVIRKRYSELTPRLFPVAVTYLVPRNL